MWACNFRSVAFLFCSFILVSIFQILHFKNWLKLTNKIKIKFHLTHQLSYKQSQNISLNIFCITDFICNTATEKADYGFTPDSRRYHHTGQCLQNTNIFTSYYKPVTVAALFWIVLSLNFFNFFFWHLHFLKLFLNKSSCPFHLL